MATTILKFKCPNCHNEGLTQIDRMARCTCGWWMFLENEDDNISLQSLEYASVVAS